MEQFDDLAIFQDSSITTKDQYQPLANGEIRVLRLTRGLQEEELQLQLKSQKTDDKNLPYEALSYAWGTQTPSVPILALGLNITPSLYNALHHLRLPDKDRVLWVDAICINQKDPDERASQVEMMTDIFGRSSKVVIWLGDPDDSTQFLFEQLKPHADALPSSMLEDSAIALFQAFLLRAWFHRLWTFQEVVLSRNAEMRCGWFTLPWEAFAAYTRKLSSTPYKWVIDKVNPSVRAKVFYWSLRHGQITARGSDHFRLSRLMQHTATHHCSDPRDHFYALLGVANLQNRRYYRPDYTIREGEVWIKYIQMMMVEDGDLRCLSLLNYADTPLYLQDIDDFQDRTVCKPCAGKSIFEVMGISFIFPQPQTIRLLGKRLDTVKVVYDAYDFYNTGNSQYDYVGLVRKLGADQFLVPRVDDSGLRQVLLRVLTAGKNRDCTEDGWVTSETQSVINRVMEHRSFFVTEGGRMGIGPKRLHKSSKICALMGHNGLFLFCDGGYNENLRALHETWVDGLEDARISLERLPESEPEKWPFEIFYLP